MQLILFTKEVVPCLVMEYLPLGDLQAQHEAAALEVKEAIGVLYQSLLGIEHLHSQGIAHRDIKPENILVASRRPFHVKLADFGLAKYDNFLRSLCGTHPYVAPEIWNGSKYTTAVDIWSLGVLVFQYVYGLPEIQSEQAHGTWKAARWYGVLLRAVDDWDSDDLIDHLSSSMLREEASARSTASECLQWAKQLYWKSLDVLESREAGTETPTEVMPTPVIPVDPAEETSLERARRNVPYSDPKRVRGNYTDQGAGLDSVKLDDSEQSVTGFVQFTVGGKPVTLRQEDLWLNATEILALTGKTAKQRQQLLQVWRVRAPDEIEDAADNSWISRRVAIILCDVLQLEEVLAPLLRYERTTVVKCRGTVEFNQIIDGRNLVSIRSKDHWVNAAHILNAARVDRSNLALKLRREVPHDIVRGSPAHQGTYINTHDAVELCEKHGLLSIRDILRDILSGRYFSKSGAQRNSNPALSVASARHNTSPARHEKHRQTHVTIASSSPTCKTPLDPDSFFTEPSYSHGSYLPRMKGSVLEQVSPKLQQHLSPSFEQYNF